jgi:hypothetical protein
MPSLTAARYCDSSPDGVRVPRNVYSREVPYIPARKGSRITSSNPAAPSRYPTGSVAVARWTIPRWRITVPALADRERLALGSSILSRSTAWLLMMPSLALRRSDRQSTNQVEALPPAHGHQCNGRHHPGAGDPGSRSPKIRRCASRERRSVRRDRIRPTPIFTAISRGNRPPDGVQVPPQICRSVRRLTYPPPVC